MPHRVIGLWMILVGILGVIIVAVFVLVGIDARRASATGPRWKRKLLATGLVLLTSAGIVGCDSNSEITSTRTSAVQDAALDSLLKDRRWLEYRSAWDRAEDIALGRIEAMPIYSDEMPAEISALTKAGANLDVLVSSGLITDVEHIYLKCELSLLIGSLSSARVYPVLLKQIASPEASFQRMSKRMAALGKLASSTSVPAEVWECISPEILKDAEVLGIASRSGKPVLRSPDKALNVYREAREHILKIMSLRKGSDLEHDKAWREFVMDRGVVDGIFEYPGVGFLIGGYESGVKAFQKMQSRLAAFKRAGRLSEPIVELFEIEHSVSKDILFPTAVASRSGSVDGKEEEEWVLAAVGRMKLRKDALGDLARSTRIRAEVVGDALAMAQADYYVLSDRQPTPFDVKRGMMKGNVEAKNAVASITPNMVELRRKISRCDSGAADFGRQYHWVRLHRIWRRSEHLWEMNVGRWPYNTRGKEHALSLILEARRHIESLENAGMLDRAEAELIGAEFKKMREGIDGVRSSDSVWTTSCYLERGGDDPSGESMEKFMKRLELLEKIQATGKLHPRVLATVLYDMERQIPVPQVQEEWEWWVEEAFGLDDQPVFPAQTAAERIDRLKEAHRTWRAKLPGDRRWTDITGSIRFAETVAKAEKHIYQDRKTAWMRLCKAKLTVRELLSEGMLTRDEAVLVGHGIDAFWDIIVRRPIDALQLRLLRSNTPWSVIGDGGRDALVGAGPYPGYRNMSHWLDTLGKASDPDQVSPVVHKEVVRQLKVLLPCQRKQLLKEYENDLYGEDWYDYDDTVDAGAEENMMPDFLLAPDAVEDKQPSETDGGDDN